MLSSYFVDSSSDYTDYGWTFSELLLLSGLLLLGSYSTLELFISSYYFFNYSLNALISSDCDEYSLLSTSYSVSFILVLFATL